MRQYLRNAGGRRDEHDWMCARTMRTAEEWLTVNAAHPRFLLWIDTWDPHEPFDAPAELLGRYAPADYEGDRVTYPQYGRPYLDANELDFVRASYAAKVTLVDRAVGRLLARIDALGLAATTLVIFLTDHGHLFGEHDLEGKPTGPLGWLYEPTIRVPLVIRHPDGYGRGTRPDAIAQHVDLLPTILEFLDVPRPAGLEGRSLLPDLGVPVSAGSAVEVPGFAVSGRRNEWHGDAAAFDGAAGRPSRAEPITVSDDRFTLMCGPLGSRRLFDRAGDPAQTTEISSPRTARRLEEYLFEFLRARDAPEGFVASYRGGSAGAVSKTSRDRGRTGETSPLDAPMLVFELAPGRVLAFVSVADARACLDRDDLEVLETRPFATLLRDSRVLVYLGQQYYRPADLADQPWAELLTGGSSLAA
jgi:arylsulfatase A-like enzyme